MIHNQTQTQIQNQNQNQNPEIRGLLRILALHLIPGIIVVCGYSLLLSWSPLAEFPRAFVLGLAVLFCLVPAELGLLYFVAKKETGNLRLKPILGMQARMSIPAYTAYTLGLFVAVGTLITALKPISNLLFTACTQWLPVEFLLAEDLSRYGNSQLIATLVVQLLLLTLVGPIVEELYFRGFLLTRMKHLGIPGVLLNTLLFSLYHLWSPWLLVTRFVAMLPLYWVASKKDSLMLAILVHCLCNFTDVLALLSLLM